MDEAGRAPQSKPKNRRSAARRNAHVGAVRLAASLALGFALTPGSNDCWAQAGAAARGRGTQEIAPFRLTGIDGYMVTRYLSDDNSTSAQTGGAAARARQSNMIEEISLMTHSYVYHPTLLMLDLGGGPVIDKSSVDSDGVATNSRRQQFNFSGRATVLRDKPYTGALFYDRHNQTQSLGPAEVLVTESARYGLNFSLLSPLTTIPMQMELTRSENQGSGAEQIINDRIDQLRINMQTGIGKLGTSAFQYLGTRQDSVSGSTGQPIQASHSNNDGVNLDTRLKFGAAKEYDFNNVVTLNTNRFTTGQGTFTQLQELHVGFDLYGRHSSDVQSFWRYNNNSSKQDTQEMHLNTASAGLSYRWDQDLSGTLSARGEDNKTTQLNSTLYGLDGSALYRRALPLGEATAAYNFAYSRRDQQASEQQAQVIGEHVTLVGTALVPLNNQQVVASSVVVNNLTRTQVFVEGRDYVLSQLGLTTRIQRVIGGNILDGQEVLVDYAFATGGTFALSQLDNTVSLNWGIKSYLNVYVRHLDSAPQLISGVPTSPINPATDTLYGTRAEYPLRLLSQELLLGGRVEREIRRETVAPFRRSSLDTFAQADLPLVSNGNIRVGSRRLQVDYDLSPDQGVNLVAYDLRMWARAGAGIDLSADASHERDTGAPEVRERTLLSAKAQWRRRKLLLTADLTRVRDAQGAVERTRTYGQIMLRRDF